MLFVAPVLAGDGSAPTAALPSAAHAVAPGGPSRSATTCSSKRMSTSPDPSSLRADDELVTHLSHWLTRQIGNDELLRKVREIGTDELAPRAATAIDELVAELEAAAPGERAQLEVAVARERSRRSSTATRRHPLA